MKKYEFLKNIEDREDCKNPAPKERVKYANNKCE